MSHFIVCSKELSQNYKQPFAIIMLIQVWHGFWVTMHAALYIHSYTCMCVTFYQDLSTLKNLTARRSEYAATQSILFIKYFMGQTTKYGW